MTNRYVALLRGINVGGNNLIKMTDLKVCFERQGLVDVSTYIQSGNVVFSADDARPPEELAARVEGALLKTFKCSSSVVLRSLKEMKGVVARAPKGFGTQPGLYRYDVIYLKESLSAAEAVRSVPTAAGVDTARAGSGVLYFSRLIKKASQSRLSRLVSMPIYKDMTIRNWNTTTALLRMMEEA